MARFTVAATAAVALLALALALALHTPSVAAQACAADPCFAAAQLEEQCCLLNSPAIAQLSSNADLAQAGGALEAYIELACAPACSERLFGAYRGCLATAPIDQTIVADYLPTGFCELQCMRNANVDFSQLANCTQLTALSADCRASVVGVEGMIGAQMQKLFQQCSLSTVEEDDDAGLIAVAAAPAPSSVDDLFASLAPAPAPANGEAAGLEDATVSLPPPIVAQEGPAEGERAIPNPALVQPSGAADPSADAYASIQPAANAAAAAKGGMAAVLGAAALVVMAL